MTGPTRPDLLAAGYLRIPLIVNSPIFVDNILVFVSTFHPRICNCLFAHCDDHHDACICITIHHVPVYLQLPPGGHEWSVVYSPAVVFWEDG